MKICKRFLLACAIVIIFLVSIDRWIVLSAQSKISVDAAAMPSADVILVPGAQIYGGEVSAILAERLNAAIGLWKEAAAPKILVSGDYSGKYYDEAAAMKKYLLRHAVSGSVILEDHAGFSTYDSLYRAKHVFGVHSVIVVSQDFHLPRALFIARSLGLEAAGFSASRVPLSSREAFRTGWREPLARFKAIYDVAIGTVPAFTGSGLPLDAQGKLLRW